MITYPVDPDSRWAVLQLSTGEIVSRNKPWPRVDGTEIVGLDPDYVYLQHREDARPQFDSRIYVLIGIETVDAPANELRKTWATEKRPTEEQKVAAENVEAEQLGLHIKIEREVIETRLMVAALLTYVDGVVMPAKVEAMADAYREKGVKLWRNRDRLRSILADIDEGTEPDLDAGWEAPDA